MLTKKCQAFVLLFAAILALAAALKIVSLIEGKPTQYGIVPTLAISVVECLLSLALAVFCQYRIAGFGCGLISSVFATVSLISVMHGSRSCNCFGTQLTIHPVIMVVANGLLGFGIFTYLFGVHRKSTAPPSALLLSIPRATALVLTAFALGVIAGTVISEKKRDEAKLNDYVIGVSGKNDISRTILDHVDFGDRKPTQQDHMILLFVDTGCGKCIAIREDPTKLLKWCNKEEITRLVFVYTSKAEVAGLGKSTFSARVSADSTLQFATPLLVRIDDGVATKVTLLDE